MNDVNDSEESTPPIPRWILIFLAAAIAWGIYYLIRTWPGPTGTP